MGCSRKLEGFAAVVVKRLVGSGMQLGAALAGGARRRQSEDDGEC